MSRTDLLVRAEALRQARTPYVMATVVRAQRPTSAKAGDSALILGDGTLDGFVGGTCAESTVRLQGLALLQTGESTLLRILPDMTPEALVNGENAAEGLTIVNNPCLSGGSLDIFMEAMIPALLIQVYGEAPVARALVRVGAACGYDMVAAPAAASIPPDTTAVIVASHGRDEEAVLTAAIKADVPYIALVASRKRGDVVLASLGTDRDRVRSPAGLDIGARSAAEVAVSILAEIIELKPKPALSSQQPPRMLTLITDEKAVDPVCGMDVKVTPTALAAEHAGQMYYFCGSGCKVAFSDNPHGYIHHA